MMVGFQVCIILRKKGFDWVNFFFQDLKQCWGKQHNRQQSIPSLNDREHMKETVLHSDKVEVKKKKMFQISICVENLI